MMKLSRAGHTEIDAMKLSFLDRSYDASIAEVEIPQTNEFTGVSTMSLNRVNFTNLSDEAAEKISGGETQKAMDQVSGWTKFQAWFWQTLG